MGDSVLEYAKRRLPLDAFQQFKEFYRGQGIFRLDYQIAEITDPAKALKMKRELLDEWQATQEPHESPSPTDDAVLRYLIDNQDSNIRSAAKLKETREWRDLYNTSHKRGAKKESTLLKVQQVLQQRGGLNDSPPDTSTIAKCLKALDKAENAVKK